jgi:hypothetical protein
MLATEKGQQARLNKLWSLEAELASLPPRDNVDLVIPYVGMGGPTSSPTKRFKNDFKRTTGLLGLLFSLTQQLFPEYLERTSST